MVPERLSVLPMTTTTSHQQIPTTSSARATQVVHRPGYVGAPAGSRTSHVRRDAEAARRREEALARLTVEDFPAIVVIDCEGNNLYDVNQKKYRTLKGY